MAPRGQGLFSVYICMENIKILLVKYLLTDFNNALWPSTKNVQAILICQFAGVGAAGGGGGRGGEWGQGYKNYT